MLSMEDDFTTMQFPVDERSTVSATLRLYDIFIPLLGVFIISLNLLVVISSGLLLKKRKFFFWFNLFVYSAITICCNKTDYLQWCSSGAIKRRNAIKVQREDAFMFLLEDNKHEAISHCVCLPLLFLTILGQQPRSTYLFLGNVGLSDLITGIAVLFGQLYPDNHRSDVQCAVHMGEMIQVYYENIWSHERNAWNILIKCFMKTELRLG